MKAGVFYGKDVVRIEDCPIPVPGENEVLIKVMACGICGTDIGIFNGAEGCFPTAPGTILGHEFSGVVQQLGPNITRFQIGDRVCVDPNLMCEECFYCQNDMGHFCERKTGIGTGENGGFAEYCVVPESQVYKIKPDTSFEVAAMTEPVACCLHGIDRCNISPGATVAVIGGGMIGMMMLQLAKSAGADTLILLEPIVEKRVAAQKMGVDICIDPIRENVHEVLAQHHIERISVVIECVGIPATIQQALDIAGKNAVVMLYGVSAPNVEIPVKPFELFKKEITIRSAYINPYTQRRALDLIESGEIDVASYIQGCEPLENLPDILSDVSRRKNGKVIICP